MSDSVHARSGAVKTVVENTPGRRIRVAVLVALLGIHAGLLAYSASKHSPVWEEYWHLLAGISHWETGRFDLFRVNPPLVRTVATIPVMFSGYEMDWTGYIAPDGTRPEQWLREDLFRLNGPRIFWLTTLARWTCIPFSLLGGLVCYLWARKLWGASSGLVAATIWCFSPNVLGNGQLIMPDVAAASVGVAGHYAFWRYLSVPSTRGAIVSGVLLGLTLLTKSTWIVLPPIWVTFWLAWWWRRATPRGLPATRNSELRFSSACCPELGDGSRVGEKPARPRWREFLLLALVSCYVLNLGYLFEGTFTPFGQYRFISEALGGDPKNADLQQHIPRNPYRESWLAHVPVPLPKNFVAGMDIQKRDFECRRWAYLRGEWKYGGWWYYYLYAMAIKVPLGVWGLGVLAIGLRISEFAFRIRRRGHSVVGSQMSFAQGSPATDDGQQATDNSPQSEIANCRSPIDFSRGTAGLVDELFLIAPAIVVLVLASSQTGLNCHMRYVLPAFGFLFIWISQAAKRLESRANSQNTEGRQATCERSLDPDEEFRRAARFSRVCASIRSPQFALVLALLTWFIGSSLYCYPHGLSYFNELVGGPSNGWKHLAASCTDNGQDLLYLRDWCESHPEAQPLSVVHWTHFVPLEWIGVDASRPPAGLLEAADPARVQPQAYGPLPGWYILSVNKLNERGDAYKYFRYMTPVNHIGYSMKVYHVTLEEANRVRRLLGQRELPEGWPPPKGGVRANESPVDGDGVCQRDRGTGGPSGIAFGRSPHDVGPRWARPSTAPTTAS